MSDIYRFTTEFNFDSAEAKAETDIVFVNHCKSEINSRVTFDKV